MMFGIAAALLAMALWCAWLWQPERQVRLHQRSLLRAVSKRDWPRVAELMADNYSDRWGHDKTIALDRAKQVFGQFMFLTIRADPPGAESIDPGGKWSARLVVEGRGSPIADAVEQRVAALRDPWIFTWVQQSWKPWDWTLTRVEQAELEIPEI